MSDLPDRRRNSQLREMIDDYRKQAWHATRDAAFSPKGELRERHLASANALTELGDALQGRRSLRWARRVV